MSTPISHPFLPLTLRPHRKLTLSPAGSDALYIGYLTGTNNLFPVTIRLSSRYSKIGNLVTANSCDLFQYSGVCTTT
jgi:hypothetical protein